MDIPVLTPWHTDIQYCVHIHTSVHIQICYHTGCIYPCIYRHTPMGIQTYIQVHRHTRRHMYAHPDTYLHSHRCTHRHTDALAHRCMVGRLPAPPEAACVDSLMDELQCQPGPVASKLSVLCRPAPVRAPPRRAQPISLD